MAQKIITPGKKELAVIDDYLGSLRDAGGRIIVPHHYNSSLLVNMSSGHFLIAPSDDAKLGFQFGEENKLSAEAFLPHIKFTSEFIGVYFMKDPAHKTYIIYTDPKNRDARTSLVAGREMYGVKIEKLVKNNIVCRE